MSTTGWIVLGVIVVFVLWIIMIYNQLVAMRQRVGQAFADVDVQLKLRHDLNHATPKMPAFSTA